MAPSSETIGRSGYATSFEELIDTIHNHIPQNEVIGRAFRRSMPMYPALAIRELVANALIHQDLSIRGAGPVVEIFDNRIEVSNPGGSLINVDRWLDASPRSRNEDLASLMRRMGICEELGSGIDKVVFEIELFQLPAPKFDSSQEATPCIHVCA